MTQVPKCPTLLKKMSPNEWMCSTNIWVLKNRIDQRLSSKIECHALLTGISKYSVDWPFNFKTINSISETMNNDIIYLNISATSTIFQNNYHLKPKHFSSHLSQKLSKWKRSTTAHKISITRVQQFPSIFQWFQRPNALISISIHAQYSRLLINYSS